MASSRGGRAWRMRASRSRGSYPSSSRPSVRPGHVKFLLAFAEKTLTTQKACSAHAQPANVIALLARAGALRLECIDDRSNDSRKEGTALDAHGDILLGRRRISPRERAGARNQCRDCVSGFTEA